MSPVHEIDRLRQMAEKARRGRKAALEMAHELAPQREWIERPSTIVIEVAAAVACTAMLALFFAMIWGIV